VHWDISKLIGLFQIRKTVFHVSFYCTYRYFRGVQICAKGRRNNNDLDEGSNSRLTGTTCDALQFSPVQSSPVQFSSIQSSPVQFNPVQSSSLQSSSLQSSSVQSSSVHSSPVQFSSIQSSPVEFSLIQSSSVHSSPVQFSSIQSSPVQFSSIQSSSVQSSPVQFSPVQNVALSRLPTSTWIFCYTDVWLHCSFARASNTPSRTTTRTYSMYSTCKCALLWS
jgi:hypothetical protein